MSSPRPRRPRPTPRARWGRRGRRDGGRGAPASTQCSRSNAARASPYHAHRRGRMPRAESRRLDPPLFFSPLTHRPMGDVISTTSPVCYPWPSMKASLSILALALGLVIAPGARGAGAFGSPVVVTGLDTGEPGIDVAPDGTIYVNAPAGLLSNLPGSPSFVFRSDDGGATWTPTPAGSRANLPGGGDSDLSIDPATGTLYMTDLWLGSATVSRSADRGATWLANPLQGVVVQDRQWVASAGGGNASHARHQIRPGLVVSSPARPPAGAVHPVPALAPPPA